MQTLKEEIRFVDLMPDVPLTENPQGVIEAFADGIAELKIHGTNFTATYFQWARDASGLFLRVPTIKITRQLSSVFGMHERLTELMQQKPIGIVPH